jgi:CheY-like chemotaxis protein
MALFTRATKPGHILLLDDEPSIRSLFTRVLEQHGYNVQAARTADEAMHAIGPGLKAAILDVILVTSGGRSGIDVLAAIRRDPVTADVPVLMLTGYGLNPEVQAAIAQHGAELLHKPVPNEVVVDWLARTIGE